VALSCTEVPVVWGEAGVAVMVTLVQGGAVWSVYVGLGETCASQDALEPDCLAQTSNR